MPLGPLVSESVCIEILDGSTSYINPQCSQAQLVTAALPGSVQTLATQIVTLNLLGQGNPYSWKGAGWGVVLRLVATF